MRIAYFGLPLGAWLLHADGHPLPLVVLSPVEAPGRRRVRRMEGSRVIDALGCAPARFSSLVDTALADVGVELIVSWFWTRRLPEHWLARAPGGGIGVHPSLLPRHRGPNPFFHAIDAGDATTGITVHRLTSEYDTGDILLQIEVPIGERNAWQLARALDRPSLSGLRDVVGRLARGESLPATPQDESQATWADEPQGALLTADFRQPADRVLRRIRALSPVPGLALEIREQPLFVVAARRHRAPAELLVGEAGACDGRVVIRCGAGAIALERAIAAEGGELAEGVELSGPELAAWFAETGARAGN